MAAIELENHYIYGSQRIGINKNSDKTKMNRQNIHYELTNHLGNVMATIRGAKIQNASGYGYRADIVSTTTYGVFGNTIEEWSYSSNSYKFGFNGQVKDDEIYGAGNTYDLGLREYDTRLGRMFSIDPRSIEYPWQSPYVYHRNNPIAFLDFMGGGDPEKLAEKSNTSSSVSTLENGVTISESSISTNTLYYNPDTKDYTIETSITTTLESRNKQGELISSSNTTSTSTQFFNIPINASDNEINNQLNSIYSTFIDLSGTMTTINEFANIQMSNSLMSGLVRYEYGNNFWYGGKYGVYLGYPQNTMPNESLLKSAATSRNLGYGFAVASASISWFSYFYDPSYGNNFISKEFELFSDNIAAGLSTNILTLPISYTYTRFKPVFKTTTATERYYASYSYNSSALRAAYQMGLEREKRIQLNNFMIQEFKR